MEEKMTIDEAIKILDPDVEYNGEELIPNISELSDIHAFIRLLAVREEACRVLCKVARQWQRDMVCGGQ